jgi:uncharacterized protein DUF6172
MKKTFLLQELGKENPRVVESIKNDVRKYVKRERRKTLPEGVDFWDFDCKVGADHIEPANKHLAELGAAIDAIALAGGTTVYVEILSKPGHRTKKPAAVSPDASVTGEPLVAPPTEPEQRID